MAKHAWIALVIVAAACAVAPLCRADDETPDAANASDSSPGVTTIDELLEATAYADTRFVPTTLGPAADMVIAPDIALDFEENGFVRRVIRERSLPFFTISNQRRSRLFLGINEDGYFGLHLIGKPDASDRASFDVVPLPPVEAEAD